MSVYIPSLAHAVFGEPWCDTAPVSQCHLGRSNGKALVHMVGWITGMDTFRTLHRAQDLTAALVERQRLRMFPSCPLALP